MYICFGACVLQGLSGFLPFCIVLGFLSEQLKKLNVKSTATNNTRNNSNNRYKLKILFVKCISFIN